MPVTSWRVNPALLRGFDHSTFAIADRHQRKHVDVGGIELAQAIDGLGGRLFGNASGGTIGTCTGAFAIDFNQFAATQTADPSLIAGATVDMQCWFRDPPAPNGAVLSNALSFVLCP